MKAKVPGVHKSHNAAARLSLLINYGSNFVRTML